MVKGAVFDSAGGKPAFREERKEDSRSDEEIFDLVPENKDFFGILIRRYERPLMSYLRRMNGGSTEEVEDMAQNIFLKAYVYLHSFRRGDRFSSWLFGIAHNECIDFWRRNKKHSATVSLEASEGLRAVLRSDHDLGAEAERQWSAEALRRSLEKLPFRYREILMLRFLEDRSYEEIAAILKKPVATVGTLIRRAKQSLKSLIGEKHES